jgi:tRNA(His) 5'-end guanylyltransferase
MGHMDATAKYLCENISGACFAFTQSDEISIVVDRGTEKTQPWFGGVQAKIVSIAASLATCMYNARTANLDNLAQFDARVFVLPTVLEIVNYLIWRQRDCVRNSIMMVGQSKFSHKQLDGKKTNEVQEMLWDQHHINWNDFTPGEKRGRIVYREPENFETSYKHKKTGVTHVVSGVRTHWVVSGAIHFTPNTEWLDDFMTPMLDEGGDDGAK